MKITEIKDYSEDDSTQTVEQISGVTEHNCVVMNREYTYIEEDDPTLEIKIGLEIILEVPERDLDEQVYRSLEDLREEVEGEMPVELVDD